MKDAKRWLLPDGVDELLPDQARRLEHARRATVDFFHTAGFKLIQPPLIEFTDSLLIGLGEDVAAQTMRLTDQLSGRPMALRADVSSQAARIDVHSMHSESVNRLCYVEPVVLAKPQSPWSSRCPLLAGAEIFGSVDVDADIEVVLLMLGLLNEVAASFTGTGTGSSAEPLALTLDLGHVGVSRAIFDVLSERGCSATEINALQDVLQRKSAGDLEALLDSFAIDAGLKQLLAKLPTLCGGAEILTEAKTLLAPLAPAVDAALADMQAVIDVVSACFPDLSIYCDVAEARGYSYHTGLVFAVYSDQTGVALANGGRYDGVGEVFGRQRPATGFNTDLKALRRLFEGAAAIDSQAAEGHIILAPAPSAVMQSAEANMQSLWQAVAELRAAGETVAFASNSETAAAPRELRWQDGQWSVVQR